MRRLLLGVPILLAFAAMPARSDAPPAPEAAAASEKPALQALETVLSMPVDGRIVIREDGSVDHYSLDTPLTEGLIALLDKSIPAWRFEPMALDGKPVRVDARMRILLAAKKDGEGYQVRIENVVFPPEIGEPEKPDHSESGKVVFVDRNMPPPTYPKELLMAGVSGKVLLGIRFSPDGHVADVVAVQSMLYNVRGHDRSLANAIKLLEQSAVRKAREWTVAMKVAPGVVTNAKDYTALTPVEYVMVEHLGDKPPSEQPAGTWRQLSRTPLRPMPWLNGLEGVKDVHVTDLGYGEMLSLEGGPKLKTPLANTLL